MIWNRSGSPRSPGGNDYNSATDYPVGPIWISRILEPSGPSQHVGPSKPPESPKLPEPSGPSDSPEPSEPAELPEPSDALGLCLHQG